MTRKWRGKECSSLQKSTCNTEKKLKDNIKVDFSEIGCEVKGSGTNSESPQIWVFEAGTVEPSDSVSARLFHISSCCPWLLIFRTYLITKFV
jgi:hypothetical protein